MKTTHRIMWDRLYIKLGLDPRQKTYTVPSCIELKQTQWSKPFETYMRNRLLMGYYRYGLLGSPEKGLFDNMNSALRRIKLYKETGNQEHLVDIANLCMIEFLHPNHKNPHFLAQDDGAEHAQPL